MDKIFHTVVEIIYWVLIFLSPVFGFLLVGLMLVTLADLPVGYLYGSLCVGAVPGVILAERIRRKYGCANFWSRIYGSSGIEDAARDENQKS
jgi:uncharacterized membrane-anchored protein